MFVRTSTSDSSQVPREHVDNSLLTRDPEDGPHVRMLCINVDEQCFDVLSLTREGERQS